jgi:hypothetical protein
MCEFNTGCPGWTGGYEDGFVPCSEDLGCATAYAESLNDLREYPIESKGRYDRYATGPEDSEWVCGDCGEICDPDTHDEECHVSEQFRVEPDEDDDMEDSLFYRLTASQLGFHSHT